MKNLHDALGIISDIPLKKHRQIKHISNIVEKGFNCSKEGKKYEIEIYKIVSKCIFIQSGKIFNTQKIDELGGCNSKNDIECNWNIDKDIPIEIKKKNTPDWMQCTLKYDSVFNKWVGSLKNKIPEKSKQIFEELISDKKLFHGNIPEFMIRNITHEEWLNIKKNTNDFNDVYFDCPNDTIQKLYSYKDCKYIQISDKGLYHLGEDICNFNVPYFKCEQELRVRTKIHSRVNSKGFCDISIVISCKPKNINHIENSSYTLDNIDKLPLCLSYIL
jgi:hypothetical protein